MLSLFIGNKNYSSWSLRPWLVLRWAEIPFEECLIPLAGPGYGRCEIPEVVAVSPSGRVPALRLDDGTVVHDSLAIAEWAAEHRPGASLWPSDARTRALARAATAEMHSGFAAVRRDLSMNIRRRMDACPALPEDTNRDLVRLWALWEAALAEHGGPWLFGQRGIADAFFVPVATRLRTYSVPVPPAARAYVDQLLADADFRAWEAAGRSEPWLIEQTEALYRSRSP
jgi:glutathione S-transferase